METPRAGEVVVVVGAASGIGATVAARLKGAGAQVVGLDRDARVHDVFREGEIDAPDGAVASHQVDATDVEQLRLAAEHIEQHFGRVDHVVVSIGCCSGTFGFPFWNLDPTQWQHVVEVNLIAPVNVAHAFQASLRTRAQSSPDADASLCLVASVAGQIGSQTDPPYSAAKAGLINFAQCAAKDLAPFQVRVNAVSPGMVKTPMNRQVWQAWREQSPEHRLTYEQWAEAKIQQVSPLGRWQSCEDVALAIDFLTSPAARNITGQTINVDGGQVMHA